MRDSEKPNDSLLKQIFVTQTKGFVDVLKKNSFWSDFAAQKGGVFKLKQTLSRDLTSFHIMIQLENGKLEFTESDTHPLKVICTINSSKQAEFEITQQDFIDRFLKVFGLRSITISNQDFDKKYLLKGTDENTVRNIIKRKSIIHLILKTNIYSISCTVVSKQLIIMGMLGRSVNSINEMHDVYCLFEEIIDQINKQ